MYERLIFQVNDGVSDFGRFCGGVVPDPITSGQNTMYVKFKSDSQIALSGFRAAWIVGKCGVSTLPLKP